MFQSLYAYLALSIAGRGGTVVLNGGGGSTSARATVSVVALSIQLSKRSTRRVVYA